MSKKNTILYKLNPIDRDYILNRLKEKDQRIKELEKENTSLKSELHCKVDYIHEIVNVKDDYKKQLYELPKKICDDIIYKIKNELYESDLDIKYDYEYVVTLFYLKNIFNEIQSKYE